MHSETLDLLLPAQGMKKLHASGMIYCMETSCLPKFKLEIEILLYTGCCGRSRATAAFPFRVCGQRLVIVRGLQSVRCGQCLHWRSYLACPCSTLWKSSKHSYPSALWASTPVVSLSPLKILKPDCLPRRTSVVSCVICKCRWVFKPRYSAVIGAELSMCNKIWCVA